MKKGPDLKDVDSLWDFLVVLLLWLRKNWYIAVIIIIVAATAVCGFTITCGSGTVVKEPLKIKEEIKQ